MGADMKENHFIRRALNNAWANSTIYEDLNTLRKNEFWAERPGFFGSLGRTMNHIYEVDLYYVDALTEGGKGRSVFDRPDLQNPTELSVRQSEVDMAFAMFCGALTEDELTSTVPTERKDGIVEERVDYLILHLVQHQIHHRGQAHAMLSHAGFEPPQLDEFYLEFGRAETAKPYWS